MIAAFKSRRWIVFLAVSAVLAATASAMLVLLPGSRVSRESIPEPPYSETKNLNANPDVAYIGSAACANCHKSQHKSYLLTAHSKALSDLDPSVEPPDGSFEHRASGHTFRIYRADGKMRHAEIVRDEDGKEVARVDLPIKYLIGSGNFSRSYLIEADGFLHESPITWYASKKKWDMSPGYDKPQHHGFERPIVAGCLACHSGRFEVEPGTSHQVKFIEKAIGCESCHGPGALHQELHQSKRHKAGADDFTIVHPGKLPRNLQEAICASCHLSSAETVYLRGRKETDFRPGRPLSDYRTDYRLAGSEASMTVVGHVEQMHNSKCYQKSEMTCLTCHDPHQRELAKDRLAAQQQMCATCHQPTACTGPADARKKKSDHCVACHMPQQDTEIPHIAFTHHRIGRHSAKIAQPILPSTLIDTVKSDDVPELVPLEGQKLPAEPDQLRNLGLAYFEQSRISQWHAELGEKARVKLEAAYEYGVRDGATLQSLGELYARANSPKALAYLQAALDSSQTPTARAASMYSLASLKMQKQDYAAASKILEDTVRIRRFADDWRMLGACRLKLQLPDRAKDAFQQSIAIHPFLPNARYGLAEAYRQLNDQKRADEQDRIGMWLAHHNRD